MFLLLLAACVGGGPADTGDTDRSDTAADTALVDDTATETGDSDSDTEDTEPPVYVGLDIEIDGPGAVVVQPGGARCEQSCSVQVPENRRVTLSAVPDQDHGVAAWTGLCSGDSAVCALDLAGAGRRQVGVAFEWAPCREFVTLTEEGRFELDGQPYAMQGVNFHISLGARIVNVESAASPDDYEYELFLAPYGYYPKSGGVCAWEWSDPATCCDDAESCRALLVEDHIARMVDLGINSIRLVGFGNDYAESGSTTPYTSCERVFDSKTRADFDSGWRCRAPLGTDTQRDRFLELTREAIDLLGEHGIRTVLLPGSHNHFRPGAREDYLQHLTDLATHLKDDPFLVAYDPMNEPVYAYHAPADDPYITSVCPDGLCKAAAAKITRDWFESITKVDPNHLVTVGSGLTTASSVWDPFVMWDHFSSWHVYPQAPWAGSPHGARLMRQQVYTASLAACGVPCPYGGDFDGTRCHLGETPLDAVPFTWETGLYYPYQASGERCPYGSDDGANCHVASWMPGRDALSIEPQPFFYVAAKAGDCPAGAGFDGANCVFGSGPVGVDGFLHAEGGVTGFYYPYPDGTSASCVAPATDDGANCRFGDVPSGWDAFIVYKRHFFVDAVTCGPRKPAFWGETGFATFPNGQDLDPQFYSQSSDLQRKYNECAQPDDQPPHGTEDEQVDYLVGGITPEWDGLFQESLDCGFQGMHWWLFAGINWGLCAQDHFGLYRHWWLDGSTTPPGGDQQAIVKRPVADDFAAMDYLADPGLCEVPSDLYGSTSRGSTDHTFYGKVIDGSGQPVTHAYVWTWGSDWASNHDAWTNHKGEFTVQVRGCFPRMGATAFGKTVVYKNGSCTANVGTFTLHDHPDVIDWQADLSPPHDRAQSCLVHGEWRTP